MTKKKQKRFTAERKVEIAIELIKGSSLEELSRKTGRAAHELSSWKKTFMEQGSSGFKNKSTNADDPSKVKEKELKAKIGDLVMKAELLEEKIDRLEEKKGPLVFRRS